MINVLVNGCNGRMGQEVIKQIDNYSNLLLVAGFDQFDNGLNTFPVFTNTEKINENIDVIIDFSVPSATLNILEYAKTNNIAMVIATTGFNDEQLDIIKDYSKYIPIFKSANMSFDICLMSRIVANLAQLLKDNDIEIIETHHHNKIDAPSGTAMLLADSINKSLGNKMKYVFDRSSIHSKREQNEIGISSIRGGNIVGEHTVKFFGPFETFEIKHTSYSRSVFADGALKAAEFITTQPAGLYDMNNLF